MSEHLPGRCSRQRCRGYRNRKPRRRRNHSLGGQRRAQRGRCQRDATLVQKSPQLVHCPADAFLRGILADAQRRAHGAQILPRDRWSIVAYIRALQLSQNASINDVPPEARGQLGQGRQP